MTEPYISPAELGAEFGKSREWVMSKCRGEQPEWPHLRVGKSVLFTDEHVDWIREHLSVTPKPAPVEANAWGHRGRSA